MSNEDIVEILVTNGIEVVAITDHHKIDVQRVKELQKIGDGKLVVLPGIEFRDSHGGKPIHYICVFAEDCDLDHVWRRLEGGLGLTTRDVQQKGGDKSIYVPINEGAKLARSLGGVMSIHAGAKANSIESISNREQFQQRIKYDITKDYVDIMEIGQLKDVDAYYYKVFPQIRLEKPLIVCSDCHDILKYSVRAATWIRADPTFRGLLMALREPRDRVFIGDRPPQLERIEQNPTKYIKSVSFHGKGETSESEHWFDGKVTFNPGLVAIIGNKGSGKSALSDSLGLLGSTRNSDSFSFLCKERFCHPTAGHSQHYEATLEWESGEEITRCLGESIGSDEVERLKYLPQNHVEKVCNELVELGQGDFEHELGAVIFSHVPDTQRLGCISLTELIDFRNSEKIKRVDSLIRQLKGMSRVRAELEAQNDPVFRRTLKKQLRQKELELEAHEKAKPAAVPNPLNAGASTEENKPLLEELTTVQKQKEEVTGQIKEVRTKLQEAARRLAVASRLTETLDNFIKEFERFKESLLPDATELGLKADDLVTLSIRRSSVDKILTESTKQQKKAKDLLEDVSHSGLQNQLKRAKARIAEIQSQLNAPNKAYQDYLINLEEWQKRHNEIIGSESDAESVEGLKTRLSELDQLPTKIEEQRKKQIEIALAVHAEKLGQVSVYEDLYKPVQLFIDSHPLAQGKLKMEFRAELTSEGFSDRLLGLLSLNKKSSFMGIDEGHTKAEEFIQAVEWHKIDSVESFLQKVDRALHEDQRDKPVVATLLKDQVVRGVKPEDVFNLLYSLEYVRPKYVLQWEGKDLEMLSPGERGTLLLVFYLLIEKGNVPLIIDQPEGNLDNYTIAKVLVDCIKAARETRQVFIVTHNPNLAVVCDADQVVYASMDKSSGYSVSYITGALENPLISVHVTDVLEGTRPAFRVRDGKYIAAQDV